eukprot:TRINITY_DN1632_c0_g1_i1.p1 TRINITY_DN1632_c0_g1~~TRINITY_DN1632_c0_g1_i1.p1  ORF type:complete len:151 (-),score=15.42 TRINITY_DN1632_c0_g1_i1:119-571(-)
MSLLLSTARNRALPLGAITPLENPPPTNAPRPPTEVPSNQFHPQRRVAESRRRQLNNSQTNASAFPAMPGSMIGSWQGMTQRQPRASPNPQPTAVAGEQTSTEANQPPSGQQSAAPNQQPRWQWPWSGCSLSQIICFTVVVVLAIIVVVL